MPLKNALRLAILATLLLGISGVAHAQLAQNGQTTLSTFWNTANLTRTVSHTTPNLQNRLLIVTLHLNVNPAAGANAASVTYGGNALFLADALTEAGDDVRLETWFMIAPPTGANNVVVTMQGLGGATVDGVIGAVTFVDVNQTLTGSIGYTAEGNSNTPTNGGLAGTTAGDLIVDFMAARQNAGGTLTAAVGGGQTSVYNVNSPAPLDASSVLSVASTEVSTGAAVTMTYTLNAARQWVMIGGSLRPATTDVSITGIATPDVIDVSAQNIVFTFTIKANSVGANAINFADTLPAGLTIVSAVPSQGTCTPGATTNCSIGSLAPNATATVTLTASTAGGTPGVVYNNAASIGSGTTDAVAANNNVTVTVRTQGQLCATPGKDGAGATLTGTINTYFPGSASAAAGAVSITVGAAPAGYGTTNITAGDLLLVMQMQDAAVDFADNDERYGDGAGIPGGTGSAGSGSSNLNNAGRYEYVVATNAVTAAAGGTINITGVGLNNGLLYAYTNAAATGTMGQRRFQVIRVPQHTTATITPAIVTPAWNGAVGGVFALDAMGTVTMGAAAGTGTVAVTAGSVVLTGTGTTFLSQIRSGDIINVTGETARTVVRVVSNTQLWVSAAFAVTNGARTYTVPTLSVSAIGFRGGAGRQLAGGAGANTDYRTTAANAANGQKGEGFAGTPQYLFNNSATPLNTGVEGYPNGSSARGAPGNAGGGGTDGETVSNQMNTGGGGGANGGAGGNGGNAWNNNAPSGGYGGIFPFATTTRLTIGGGGGAATTNNATADVPAGTPAMGAGIASSGAHGGGMVIIRANTITGTGTISANGGWALNVANDSGGGGGAGGTVILNTRYGALTGVTIQARGGRGGNAWLAQASPCSVGPCPPNARDYPGERHGPGGGGGGGVVYISSAAASVDVTGGANGLTTTDNDNFGANPGLPGLTVVPLGVMAGAGANYGCAVADLAVTNTDTPDPVTPGANITYTQTLTNNGPNPADQPVFTTSVPASATFVSMTPPAGWSCTTPAVGGTGLVSCTATAGVIASGASVNFSFVVQAHPGTPAGYTISNTCSVASQTADSNSANDSATTTTLVTALGYADLAVVITDTPDPVLANNNITYTQTVTNGGSSPAVNATFTETIPANTTFQSLTPPVGWSCVTPPVNGTGTITCTNPSMAAGATASFPMVVRVNAGTAAGTVITETATVSSTTPDAYTANNSSTTTTTVRATGTADLAVTVVASPDPVIPGGLVTFTETVTNNGPSASANVSFTQQTPVGTTFQGITIPAGWTCPTLPAIGGTGTITCTETSFPSGTVSTFPIVFRVNGTTAAGSTITLPGAGAVVSATTVDPVAANNSANDSVLVAAPTSADVAIVKSDSPDPVGQGQLVTYILTVTNNGPAVATGVVVTDTLPASAGLYSMSSSQGSCSGTTTITCNLGTLAVRNNATISIVVQATAVGTMTNNVSVTRNETDPVAANNSDSEPTTVLAVTLVRLRDFGVRVGKSKTQLVWQTDFEADTLGFNVYREAGGFRTKLNKHLIAGSALSRPRNIRSGNVYRFTTDADPSDAFVQYWLEDVDLSGRKSMHGPGTQRVDALLDEPDSPPLAGLGDRGRTSASSFHGKLRTSAIPGVGDGESVVASPAGHGVARDVTTFSADAAQVTQQYGLAGENALKIFVSREGWQRVTRAAMVAAGFDPGTDAASLALFSIGTECAIRVDTGGNASFDEPTDAIEFFGLPLDTTSTGARTYWLVLDTGDGDRVATTSATPADPLTSGVAFSHERKERGIWFPAAISNGEGQNYFGPIVTSTVATQELTLGNVDTSHAGDASLTVVLQGGTDVAHSVELSINDHVVGTAAYPKLQQASFTYPFPQAWLLSGTNVVKFRSLNGDEDVSGVASTRIDYQHLLTADDGAFLANLPGGRTATVAGFAAGTVRAVDVTDPTQPSELTTNVDGSGNATFTPAGSGTRTVLVFHASRVVEPAELALNVPSTWHATKATNAANMVVISNDDFLAAATTLAPVRNAEGIATTVVNVDDLYDEFNFGIRDPRAIRSFLEDSTGWSTAPRFAMLVGDASIDPRGYLDVGSYDFLPSKLVATTELKTASDDWLADFNDDGIADLAIGRIPVRTATEATRIFNRLIARGTPSGSWSTSALMVSDVATEYDFSAVTTDLINLLPASIGSQRVEIAGNPGAGTQITSAMNSGQLLVNYIGHGSVELWSDSVFDTTTAGTLANAERLPFAVVMNCLNGYFHDLFTSSIAEGLMNAPNGGAIAVWASSSLTQPDQQAIMNRELYRQLFTSAMPIGEAVRRAKVAATDQDVRKSWILFGDPSMTLSAALVQAEAVAMSTVTANPASIVANGSSTSTITVQHVIAGGTNVTTGGATVVLSTTAGTLSTPVDNGNGTYTATLTSPTTAATATITGTLNGASLSSAATVMLTAGPAVSFVVGAPAETDPGTPLTVTVTPRDANGNTASGYDGQIRFTSNDPAATLPQNYTFVGADNGVHTFAGAVTMQTIGSRSITVADTVSASLNGSAAVTVNGADTTTYIDTTPNPSGPGGMIALLATVTSDNPATITGTVTFKDGATTLGSGPVTNGTASFQTSSLSAGSHSITAEYSGDSTFVPSTSAALTHRVDVILTFPTIVATAASPTSVQITWNAISGALAYDVFRMSGNGPYSMIGESSTTVFTDSTAAPNTAYLYKVRGRAGESVGALSMPDPATTIVFTDDPIGNGTTIKAVHITQLRLAVNALRAAAGLPEASFTDPALVAGVTAKQVHITELRTALDAARNALGLATGGYTDPTLPPGTAMKREHVSQLRDGVR